MITTEFFYWALFGAVALAYALVVHVFKLKKEHPVRDWTQALFEAMLIASFLRIGVIQSFAIPTGSMEDTLRIGDHPMALKFSYGLYNPLSGKMIFDFKKPWRGEVVILRDPTGRSNEMWIKRCIAVAGDTVEMKDKTLFINGIKIQEPYVTYRDLRVFPFPHTTRDNFPKLAIPEGYVFLMGDNRDQSYDSRFFGPVPLTLIRGKGLLVYWPPNRLKLIEHFKFNL